MPKKKGELKNIFKGNKPVTICEFDELTKERQDTAFFMGYSAMFFTALDADDVERCIKMATEGGPSGVVGMMAMQNRSAIFAALNIVLAIPDGDPHG